jgi:hypothetical protein
VATGCKRTVGNMAQRGNCVKSEFAEICYGSETEDIAANDVELQICKKEQRKVFQKWLLDGAK